MQDRPYSQAAENNKAPILSVLQQHCQTPGTLLEIGAGTGQHAAWLSGRLPHLRWQPSDVATNLPAIRTWQNEPFNRAEPPLELDVSGDWPTGPYDYLYTANTFHIMAVPLVERCIAQGCQRLGPTGRFLIYGPFNYNGQFTSDSNARFDRWLKDVDRERGIRDQEWVVEQFEQEGLALLADHAMPANNRILVFGR
ncbi:MAG: class I SAM-dependent methyltransferase [Pseudomonadales bacterium]|nr:class I SAM-dependent methyltransferase [Pseudomonadales bacterium]